MHKTDRKSPIYLAGRRAGAAGKPATDNPHPRAVMTYCDWELGHIDGWEDSGRRKAAERARRDAEKTALKAQKAAKKV